MSQTTRRVLVGGVLVVALALISLGVSILPSLPPPNLYWALTSGYYRYDPRHETPPAGLMRERPEDSLHYFLDATLRACSGVYPASLHRKIARYEVESVEYFGKTDYHAFSNVHTRLYFTDGGSALAIFRFEAGHNETDLVLSLGETSAIRTGSWMSLGSLVRAPDVPPPGWSQYEEDERPFSCPLTAQPYAMQEWKK